MITHDGLIVHGVAIDLNDVLSFLNDQNSVSVAGDSLSLLVVVVVLSLNELVAGKELDFMLEDVHEFLGLQNVGQLFFFQNLIQNDELLFLVLRAIVIVDLDLDVRKSHLVAEIEVSHDDRQVAFILTQLAEDLLQVFNSLLAVLFFRPARQVAVQNLDGLIVDGESQVDRGLVG